MCIHIYIYTHVYVSDILYIWYVYVYMCIYLCVYIYIYIYYVLRSIETVIHAEGPRAGTQPPSGRVPSSRWLKNGINNRLTQLKMVNKMVLDNLYDIKEIVQRNTYVWTIKPMITLMMWLKMVYCIGCGRSLSKHSVGGSGPIFSTLASDMSRCVQ